VCVVALVGLVVRVGYISVIGPKIVFGADALWYRIQASSLADGLGFVNVGELLRTGRVVPTAAFPPLWPLVLSVVDRLGGTSDWSFQLAGALAGTATIVLTACIGRVLAGRGVGLAAAVVVALSPALIAADGSMMAESLFVMLMTLAVLVSLRAARSASIWWWVALGATLALATLTRSDALFLAPILVGAAALGARSVGTTRRWLAAATAMLVLVVGLAPWIVSRSTALDTPILVSSNSGTLLEGANCARTYSGKEIGLWDFRCLTPPDPRASEPTLAAAGRDAGLAYARDHLERVPLVGVVRALRLWGLYDPIDQARGEETVESRQADWQVLAWAVFVVTLGCAVGGFVLVRRRSAEFAPLLAVIIGVTIVGIVSWGNQRFRLAAEPAIAVYAAVALVALARRVTRSGPAVRAAGES
jgi:Dolichyl-phosphate-mannose-protein mannosyltransferase